MILKEIWKDVANYEGKYQVSNLGRVKSLNYKRSGKEAILRLTPDNRGYLRIDLYKEGIRKAFRIHRLVAQAFIPNPDNLPQVNHKDENKQNNCVGNLEWCNSKYNNNYGTHNERVAKSNSKKVLCVETGIIYPSAQEAKHQTGIFNSGISRACNGRYKTAGKYHWKFC